MSEPHDGEQLSLSDQLQLQLLKADEKQLRRRLRTISKRTSTTSTIDDRELINFSHNDYLGLSQHPEVIDAATNALNIWGSGSQASRLVAGNLSLHDQLEETFAELKGTEKSLVFPTGYQASLAVLPTLVSKGETIYLDRYVHSCLVQSAKLSAGRLKVFPHNDLQALEKQLAQDHQGGWKWIVVDGVYSMDGDITPLDELLALAKKYHAIVVVDDAHATGVIGNTGRGTCEHAGIDPKNYRDNLIIIATLSKAIGSQGGIVACNAIIRAYLINKAATFIYTTGLSPANTAAAQKATELLMGSPSLVHRLQSRSREAITRLRNAGANLLQTQTPILPIICEEESRAIQMSEELRNRGILSLPIRPPTVPNGTARLRFAVNLTASDQQFETTLSHLQELFTRS